MTQTEKLEALARLASQAWDRWEQMHHEQEVYRNAGSGVPSAPRDAFESYLDRLTTDAKDALVESQHEACTSN